MDPKEYLAEVHKLDEVPDQLTEITAILAAMEQGQTIEEVEDDAHITGILVGELVEQNDENTVGYICSRGLDYWWEQTRKELDTQDILNQHR